MTRYLLYAIAALLGAVLILSALLANSHRQLREANARVVQHEQAAKAAASKAEAAEATVQSLVPEIAEADVTVATAQAHLDSLPQLPPGPAIPQIEARDELITALRDDNAKLRARMAALEEASASWHTAYTESQAQIVALNAAHQAQLNALKGKGLLFTIGSVSMSFGAGYALGRLQK